MNSEINRVTTLESTGSILIASVIFFNYIGRGLFYIDSLFILVITFYLTYKQKICFGRYINYKLPILMISSYCIYFIINVFNPTVDYYKNLTMIIHILMIFCIYYYFYLSKYRIENFKLFFKTIFILTSFLSLILIFSALSSIDLLTSLKKMELIEYNPSTFHSSQTFLSICIGFIILYVLNNNTQINKLFLLLIIIAVFVSEGKTAILTLAFGLISFYMIYFYLQNRLTLGKICFSMIILFLSFTLIFILRGDSIVDFDFNAFTSGRYEGWVLNIKLILEDNTLLGYGIFAGKLIKDMGLLGFSHPHNIFIEALLTVGLFGFIVLAILFIVYIKEVFFKSKLDVISVSTFFTVLISSQAFWSIWAKNHVIPILVIISVSLLYSKVNLEEKVSFNGGDSR